MKMLWFLFYFCPLFAVNAAQSAKNDPGKIVGGEVVDISKVQYQVSLYEFNAFACGGTLISTRHVLTAAHCITEKTTIYTLQVRLGSSDSTKGGDLVHVINITTHPLYDHSNMNYDAAMLVLHREPRFSEFPIAVAGLAKTVPEEGEYLYVSGWGATKEKGPSRNQQLRGVWLPVFNWHRCRFYHKYFRTVTEAMICAGFEKGGKDACQGDSGGPLALHGVLVGIVSWGEGCARSESPGVYTSIPHILPWIKALTNSLTTFV